MEILCIQDAIIGCNVCKQKKYALSLINAKYLPFEHGGK
jgi:hypothetical protein